jgi:uncharacterized repeat protein (TIGR01451 family)
MIRIRGYFIRSIIFLAVVILFAATEAPAAWLDGVMSSTYTTNCVSMIQGAPYMETLTMEYVGYGGNLTLPPKVGDVYYGRIVWGTTGNPCAGPYVHPEVALPQYTEFAIDATHPIECWTELTGVAGTYHQMTDGSCPTQPGVGLYGSEFYSFDTRAAGTWGGGPWPTAQGRMYYIYFPLKSSKPLAGIAGTGTLLVGAIQAIDGNNPWDGPQLGWNGLTAPSSGPYQWVTVLDSVVSMTSLTAISVTTTSAHVQGTLNHNGVNGSVFIDIAYNTAAFYANNVGPFAAAAAAAAPVSADFTSLVPGTVYKWRVRFVRADGVVTTSADQTFTTAGSSAPIPVRGNLSASVNPSWRLDFTTADMGAHYTLSAVILEPGYFFKSWTIDGVPNISTSNPYVLTMDTNHNVAALLGYYDANLSLTAAADPASIAPTGQVTYTLTVTNNGKTSLAPNADPTAPNVVVTDVLPPGMAYVSSSATGTSCTQSGSSVTCNLGTIANGATSTATIVAKPSTGLVATTVTNKATVSSPAYDSILSNNTATVDTAITAYGVSQVTSAATAGTAVKGTANVPMLQLVSMSTGTDSLKIEKITVQASGTGNDTADITSVKLYLDVNGDGVVNSGDTVLASGAFASDNGTLDLTLSTALTVTSGTVSRLLITYDFNATLAALPFAAFSLFFIGMIAAPRARRWLLLLALSAAFLGFNACGGGGGGGGGTGTAENPTPTTSPSEASTYQVSVTDVTAKGANTGQAITLPGLPIAGTTVTVNK